MSRPQASRNVAVAWDPSSRVAYGQATALTNASDDTTGFTVPGLERSTGNLLADQVVPAFAEADAVLVLWADNDPLWLGFQAGLAAGLGKPRRTVALDAEAVNARGMPGGVATFASPDALVTAAREPFAKAKPAPPTVDTRVLLCPRESAEDRTLLDRIEAADPDRTYRRVGPRGVSASAAADVLWVITAHGVGKPDESNLRPNLGNAFEAGRCYGAVLAAGGEPQLAIVRVGAVPPIVALEHLTRAADSIDTAVDLLGVSSTGPLRLVSVSLRDVKCFTSITLPLSTESPLGGAWTCLAGVNGAGKSTVLQAIAMALLGRQRAPELGLARVSRMVRRSTKKLSPEIRLTVADGGVTRDLVLPLSATSGIDDRRLAAMTDQASVDQLWEQMDSRLVVSYGATRNISDTPGAVQSMSPSAHRQLTLFDPLAQIVSAEALTIGGARFRPVLATIAMLVAAVLDEPDSRFACTVDADDRLVFQREGSPLGSMDLPDGFRSVLALLADIAAGWHELHPDATDVAGADIDAIVLVDELDLHLHARLQRLIVPRLRAALPNVQWIVTTHSPFIVGSFDQTEIVLLDRTEPDGIRLLDRQVMAFSANDLYDWLLGATPVSEAGEQALAGDAGTALLYQSPSRDQHAAQQLLEEQDDLLAKLASIPDPAPAPAGRTSSPPARRTSKA